MGSMYRISRGSHAQSVSADSITIDVPAGRMLRLHNVVFTGMDSTAAAGASIGIFRVSSNGSGGTPTSITIKNTDPNGASPPSGFTAKYGYSVQPTVEAQALYVGNFQPFGGVARFLGAAAGPLEFWSTSAYQVSIRGISGTPNLGIDLDAELL